MIHFRQLKHRNRIQILQQHTIIGIAQRQYWFDRWEVSITKPVKLTLGELHKLGLTLNTLYY